MRLTRLSTALGATLAFGVAMGLADGGRVAWSRESAAPAAAATVETRQQVLLRFAGDDMLAETIINPLARNYLEHIGAQDIRTAPAVAPWTTEISGRMSDGGRVVILVRSSSTEDGIQELIRGEVDIAMAGRQMTSEELRAMPPASGDPESSKPSVAIARSAVIMAVHPSNPVDTITIDQLRAVYAGAVTNWAQLGGHDSPIRVLAREPASTARQLFDNVVMGATPPARSVVETASFNAMHAALHDDPNAIGYMVVAGDLKVLRIEIAGHVVSSPPDSYQLASGDYPLTVVLRFYRNPRGGNPEVSHFLRKAVSAQSNFVILSAGLGELGPQLLVPMVERELPSAYRDLTRGALRVSTTIHFADGSEQVDPTAQTDLDMLAYYLRILQIRGDKLVHIAYSEDTGDPAKNRAISERLGVIVAAELERRLVMTGDVVPLGAEMPLAGNETPVGRGINRRVETWIRP